VAARSAGRDANAGLSAALRDKHRDLAEVYRQGAKREAAAAEAVNSLEDAHASRPMTAPEVRRLLKSVGMTDADLRHCQDVNALCELLGADRVIRMLASESIEARDRAHRRATRDLLSALTRAATPP
jgi:hypothetical protein